MRSRKDYVVLAEALGIAAPKVTDSDDSQEQWHKDIQAVCNALGEINPRFDKEIFIRTVKSYMP